MYRWDNKNKIQIHSNQNQKFWIHLIKVYLKQFDKTVIVAADTQMSQTIQICDFLRRQKIIRILSIKTNSIRKKSGEGFSYVQRVIVNVEKGEDFDRIAEGITIKKEKFE